MDEINPESYFARIEVCPVELLRPNNENPRTITKDAFSKLVKSLKAFPNLLNIRPIVADSKGKILGGNMRFRAALELKFLSVPVIRTDKLKPEEIEAFILLDNSSFGKWDFEALGNLYEPSLLDSFEIQVPKIDDFELPGEVLQKAIKKKTLVCPHCGEEMEP